MVMNFTHLRPNYITQLSFWIWSIYLITLYCFLFKLQCTLSCLDVMDNIIEYVQTLRCIKIIWKMVSLLVLYGVLSYYVEYWRKNTPKSNQLSVCVKEKRNQQMNLARILDPRADNDWLNQWRKSFFLYLILWYLNSDVICFFLCCILYLSRFP